MKAERGTMSGCSTGSDTASNSLALPAVQSYAVAPAVVLVWGMVKLFVGGWRRPAASRETDG